MELNDFRKHSLTTLETDSESVEELDQKPYESSSASRLKWDYKYDFEAKREDPDIPLKTSCLDPLQEPYLPEPELTVSEDIITDDDLIDVRSLDSYTPTSEDSDETFSDGSFSSEQRDEGSVGFHRYERGFTEELSPPLPENAHPLLRSQTLSSQEDLSTNSPTTLSKPSAPPLKFQSYLIKRQQSAPASSPSPPPLPKSSPPPLPVRSSQSPTSSYTSCEVDVDDRSAEVESDDLENESDGNYEDLTEEEVSDAETEENDETVEEYDDEESTEMEESNDENKNEDEMYMYEENAETDESDTPRINIDSDDDTSDEERRDNNISNSRGVFFPSTRSKYKTLEDLSSIGFQSSSDGEEQINGLMSSYPSAGGIYFRRALMTMKAAETNPEKQKEMNSKPRIFSNHVPSMLDTSKIQRSKLVIADEAKEHEVPTTPIGTPLLTPPPMFRSESPYRYKEDLIDEEESKTTPEENTSSDEVFYNYSNDDDDDDDGKDDDDNKDDDDDDDDDRDAADDKDDDDDNDDEMRHITSSYHISTARQSWNPPYPRFLEPIPESPLVTPSPTPSSISCISSISDSDNPLNMFGMSPVPTLELSSVLKDPENSGSSSSTEVASENSCLESDEDTLSLHSDCDTGQIRDSVNNRTTASELVTINNSCTRSSGELQEVDYIKTDSYDDTDNVQGHRRVSSQNTSVNTKEMEKENSVKCQENSQSYNTSEPHLSPKVRKVQILHLARKNSIRDLIPRGTVKELSKVFTITDKDGKTQKQMRVLRKLRTREIKSLEASEHKFQTFLTNTNYVNISDGEESSDSSDFENFFIASDSDVDFLEQNKERMSPVLSASSVTSDSTKVDSYQSDMVQVTQNHNSEAKHSSTLSNSNKYFESNIYASKTGPDTKTTLYTYSTNYLKEQVKQNDTVNPRQSCIKQFVHSGARKYKHSSLEAVAIQGDSLVAQVDKVTNSKSHHLRRRTVKSETNDVSPGLGGDIPATITDSIHQTESMKNSEEDKKENDDRALERSAPITMYRGSREKTCSERIPFEHYKQQRCGGDHVTSSLNNIYLSYSPLSSTTSSCSDVSSLFSFKSESRHLPAENELSIPFSEIFVTSEIDDTGIKMPEPSSGKTRVLKSSRTKTYTEDVNGEKSSKTFSETFSDDQNDINGNSIDEEEIAAVLPKLAESVAKLQNGNVEEILPGITQSVTKLKDGSGNLVITTMTRKIVEEEGEEEEIDRKSESSGRYSPVGQIIEVEDLEKGQIYLVQNSKGELYVVEDISNTSDDTQESAYYSSSRQTSESTSTSSSSPRLGTRVSNLKQVGQSSVDYDTANELISKLYNQSGIVEIEEHEDETWERSGTYSWDRSHPQTDSHPGYSTNKKRESYTTTYEYETPSSTYSQNHETVPVAGFTSVDKVTSSYGISQMPWIVDGTKSHQFQGSTSGSVDEVVNITSLPDNEAAYTISAQNTSEDKGMYTSSSAKYSFKTESTILPQPTLNTATTTVYAQPVPMLYNVPPVLVPEPQPQFKLVKFDMIPTPTVEENYTTKLVIPATGNKTVATDRPIYKTVAVIQAPEKPKPTEVIESKKYKILNSKATGPSEVKESHMTFDEVDTKYMTQSYESLVKSTPTAEKQSFVLRNGSQSFVSSTPKYRSEKQMEVKKNLDQVHKTQIDIKKEMAKSIAHTDTETYEYNLKETTHANVSSGGGGGDYGVEGILAGGFPNDTGDSDMRVIRGSYLIRNSMDEIDGEFDDNINVFDNNFALNKENPLYQSDEDIYKKYEAEREELERKQAEFQKSVSQDITYETVDKFTKSRQVTREPEKPKQSLSQLLLSKLSTIESKDIRQTIDVKHHHEDIYGDPRLEHADGSSYGGKLDATKNFDTVGEKVDLMLKGGKAYITVKVTAERIVPIDLEFNVWRKNQAIVTRVTEIDLLATEQRRRVYHQVMGSSDGGHTEAHYREANETVLSGKQTLDLFSQILNATDGQGDKEDFTVQTKQTKTSHPVMNMDLLY
ncbi:hypothetical protein CHS0354_012816 [Potamilus streckersoni]|uniref:Uncharacterized protein n=1 Tax=Potamilus streckersoni TaxID=2493646 RepID=A0AAE0SVZ3_9BIVA|nr:hypothetical protein CHS0354_012816 [Potamilus streckersoni]